MIQFIVSQPHLLDDRRDDLVDQLMKDLLDGPVLWVEDTKDLSSVSLWCENLFPRRLLLACCISTSDARIRPGLLNLITPELLHLSTPESILHSRGVLVPSSTHYRRLTHWVDDDREKNRECYRQYQQQGLNIQTIRTGNL